jgi:hypothetical protein
VFGAEYVRQLICSAKFGQSPLKIMAAICQRKERMERDEKRKQRSNLLPQDDAQQEQNKVTDFLYAMPRYQTNLGAWDDINPYDLIIVDQLQATNFTGKPREGDETTVAVSRHEYFYTVSSVGVTRQKVCDSFVKGGGEDFTPLLEWLLEKQHFDRLRGLDFFTAKKSRKHKCFCGWRRAVHESRRRRARDCMIGRHWLREPAMAAAVLQVVGASRRVVAATSLVNEAQASKTGEPFTLSEFARAQQRAADHGARALIAFSAECRHIGRRACVAVLTAEGFSISEFDSMHSEQEDRLARAAAARRAETNFEHQHEEGGLQNLHLHLHTQLPVEQLELQSAAGDKVLFVGC